MKNIEISEARTSYLRQRSTELMDGRAPPLRLPVQKLTDLTYTVEIDIGTPVVKKTLMFDTGSDITWTQCAPCPNCFKQNEPLFVRKNSISYKTITKNHPLVKRNNNIKCGRLRGCSYNIAYGGGQKSSGVVATETFTFNTKAIPKLVFGCGTKNSGKFIPQVSGILGLDRDPVSFVQQLGGMINGRFSYCLSNIMEKTTYAKFGDDTMIRGWKPQTSAFRKNTTYYELDLNDLTIDGQKLGLGRAAFGKSGCLVDSGNPVSFFNKRAFSAVRRAADKYFAKFKNVKRYVGNRVPKQMICYTQTSGLSSVPTLTFNFEGADFNVAPENIVLYFEPNLFCLAMRESDDSTTILGGHQTILGGHQQRNMRLLYDLKKMTLSFAPEDCSKDAP